MTTAAAWLKLLTVTELLLRLSVENDGDGAWTTVTGVEFLARPYRHSVLSCSDDDRPFDSIPVDV